MRIEPARRTLADVQNASANGPTSIFYGSAGTFPTTAATSITSAGYPAF
jgi:hypothetical protein